MMQRACAVCVLLLISIANVAAQTSPTPNPGAPPRVLLLVYQQFLPGKASARQALAMDIARNFDRLEVPVSWIELEALTGSPEALFFDPASSFEEIDKVGATLAQFYATHSDIAQSQGQILEAVANSRTITAVRRDDLGFRANSIDFTKARYLSVRVVEVPPAQRHDFELAEKAFQDAQSGNPDSSWAVYESNAGTREVTFLMFSPLTSLKRLDKASDQVPGPARFSGETNLYVVRPDMSHVSKEFAAGDPSFWIRKSAP
jgi:hypothetical protein